MQAWLETATGVRIGVQTPCTIGRSSSNTLALDHPEVSRRHALIHVQEREHWLVDLGSSNGVQVNQRRIRQPVRLHDQDRLEIAGNTFVFREIGPEPADGLATPAASTLATSTDSITASLWLLVADIEGFTRLSQQMPTDELAQKIGKWFLASREIIESAGGTINKYLGDGLLAYWPDPAVPSETIAGTLSALARLQEHAAPRFRWVIHFGQVTVDRSLSEGEDTLVGADVNFAFRMEKIAGNLGQSRMASAAAAFRLSTHSGFSTIGLHSVPSFEGEHRFFSFQGLSNV